MGGRSGVGQTVWRIVPNSPHFDVILSKKSKTLKLSLLRLGVYWDVESNLTGSATAWHSRGPGDGRSLYLKSRSDTKGGTLHVKFERTSAWPPNGPRPTADVHPPALTAPPGCQGSGRELFLRSDECTPEYAGTGYGPKTAAGAFSKMQ